MTTSETPLPGEGESEASRATPAGEIEAAVARATAFAAFEPNNQATWDAVRCVVEALLDSFWRRGELMGSTREEAYFVGVGADTMTDQDVEDGLLIVVVGVATLRPAEFVVFRIGQWLPPG